MDTSLTELVELTYGPDVDLHVDILKVESSASPEEIQQAFISRRIELYESLQNASMLSNTERTFKDRNGGVVTMTERHFIEKKMDALIGTFRLLSDPSKNLSYMNSSSRKKQNQSMTPTHTAGSGDSPDCVVNTPSGTTRDYHHGHPKKQESSRHKSDKVKKPVRRKLFDDSFDDTDKHQDRHDANHNASNANHPIDTPKDEKQKQIPQSILRKSRTNKEKKNKSASSRNDDDTNDVKSPNSSRNESFYLDHDREKERKELNSDSKSVGTKSINNPPKKKEREKVFVPLSKPTSSDHRMSRKMDSYYSDDDTTVNDEYGALRPRDEGLVGTVIGEIKGIVHDTMTSVEQVMNAFKIEDNDIDNFLVVLDGEQRQQL